MLGAGLIDGDLLAGLLVRTFAYTVEAYAVDHWAATQPGYGGVGYAGGSDLARRVSLALLQEVARSEDGTVLVEYDRPRVLGELLARRSVRWGLTRVALRTFDWAVVVVALKGYVEDAVARRLAKAIAGALWRDRYRVHRRPLYQYSIAPHNIDGLGTPVPSWTSVGHLLNRTR
jgi:hypothetical protein